MTDSQTINSAEMSGERLSFEPPSSFPTGTMIAEGVSVDDYMERYAENHCEWVDGKVIQKMPISELHYLLARFIADLFRWYLVFRPIGEIREDPFVMKLDVPPCRRQPDIMFVLNENKARLKPALVDGPADIVIEIVSTESMARDRGEKFAEYEQAGVPEYWILDPIHKEALFYRLNAQGVYQPHTPDADSNYFTPTLPHFMLNVPLLWAEELPTLPQIVEMVKAMVSEA